MWNPSGTQAPVSSGRQTTRWIMQSGFHSCKTFTLIIKETIGDQWVHSLQSACHWAAAKSGFFFFPDGQIILWTGSKAAKWHKWEARIVQFEDRNIKKSKMISEREPSTVIKPFSAEIFLKKAIMTQPACSTYETFYANRGPRIMFMDVSLNIT